VRPTLVEERVRLASLMLGSVDCVLRSMVADGVSDPVRTLRVLLVDSTGDDETTRRYGAMVRAIRATFVFRRNGPLVEMALQECIAIAGSLL
jgi:hypothetical protein